MKYIILLAIVIFLIYITYNPSKNLENFVNKGSVVSDKVFKKNIDVDYYDKKAKLKISDLDKILSKQIAPITDRKRGKQEKEDITVDAVDKKYTSRIPDSESNLDEYVIPMPDFDDLQGKEFRPKDFYNSLSHVEEEDDDLYIEGEEQEIDDRTDAVDEELGPEIYSGEGKKINIRKINNKDYCKFVSSFNSGDSCPSDYPVFTGANISSIGNNLSCNGSDIKIESAHAIASINNGKVTDIKVISEGSKYSQVPKVYIRGVGKNATATANVKDGKVVSVEMLSNGEGYTSTPLVIIEKPNVKVYCNLCCKKDV